MGMHISYYYQILDMGILYEKGGMRGEHWRIGERKRLKEEVSFWINLLEFISAEEKGIECSDRLFKELERLSNKYRFPHYQRILEKKWELISNNYRFERKKDEELNIRSLMKALFLEMQKNLYVYKAKKEVYDILRILHNIPKVMHGNNILNQNSHIVSYRNALLYAQRCMDEKRRKEYEKYFNIDL